MKENLFMLSREDLEICLELDLIPVNIILDNFSFNYKYDMEKKLLDIRDNFNNYRSPFKKIRNNSISRKLYKNAIEYKNYLLVPDNLPRGEKEFRKWND